MNDVVSGGKRCGEGLWGKMSSDSVNEGCDVMWIEGMGSGRKLEDMVTWSWSKEYGDMILKAIDRHSDKMCEKNKYMEQPNIIYFKKENKETIMIIKQNKKQTQNRIQWSYTKKNKYFQTR